MKLTKNFSAAEFRCNDKAKTEVPANLLCNVQELAEQLQVLRDHVGKPIVINSGYRTAAYNKSVGGSPKSQHLLAKAADIRIAGYTPKQVADIVEKLVKEGKMKIGGIGVYPTFTHLDTRATKARW